MKVTAEQTGPADSLEEFQGLQPIGYTVNTSLQGLDYPLAGGWPPDTIVGRSPLRVLEATNHALFLWDSPNDTTPELMNLNTFFNVAYDPHNIADTLIFDPKVYYDRNAPDPRFYVMAARGGAFGFQPTLSRIHVAISRSPDPPTLGLSNWCLYDFDAMRDRGTNNESYAHFPGLGVGADALVISTLQHRGQVFKFAIVHALNKVILANNFSSCPSPPTVHTFQPATNVGDTSIHTLQPVQHYTSPSSTAGFQNPVYLVSTYYAASGTGGEDNRYRIWRISNVASGQPHFTLKPTDVRGNFNYFIPPYAPQAPRDGGFPSDQLDTGVNDVRQAAGIGNALYGIHSTACNIGGGAAEACVRVVRVLVSIGANGRLVANLDQQLTLGGVDGVFYWMGGITVTLNEHIGIVFQRSSSTTRLSAYWSAKSLSASSFEPPAALTDGTCSTPFSQFGLTRTGDYTGAQTDPAGLSFWLAGERHEVDPVSGSCVWGTRIIQVTPP